MSESSFNFQAVTADPSWKIGIVKSKWNHEIVNMLASEVVNIWRFLALSSSRF